MPPQTIPSDYDLAADEFYRRGHETFYDGDDPAKATSAKHPFNALAYDQSHQTDGALQSYKTTDGTLINAPAYSWFYAGYQDAKDGWTFRSWRTSQTYWLNEYRNKPRRAAAAWVYQFGWRNFADGALLNTAPRILESTTWAGQLTEAEIRALLSEAQQARRAGSLTPATGLGASVNADAPAPTPTPTPTPGAITPAKPAGTTQAAGGFDFLQSLLVFSLLNGRGRKRRARDQEDQDDDEEDEFEAILRRARQRTR